MIQSLQKLLVDPMVSRILITAISIIVIVIAVRIVQRTVGRIIHDTDTRYRVRKLIAFLGYVVCVIVLAVVFSNKLGGLNVVLGLIGAGIAFASQEIIVSIAGWLSLAFSGFYKTGDRIQLGGVRGDVIDIGVLRTTLMEVGEWVNGDLYNGRVVRVANSFIYKEPVYNYSGDFPFLWDEIVVPIRYGSDYRMAKEILLRVADELIGDYAKNAQKAWDGIVKKYLIENAIVEPLVTMTANENWMSFTVRYVVEFKRRRTTKDQLFNRILDEINKTNGKITIASASMDINLNKPT